MPRRLLTAIAIMMATAAFAWRFLTFNGFTNDHYVFLALAQQVLLGEWPIRDFIDPGEPLTYLVSAAAWRFWGDTLIVDWAITAAAFAIGAAFTTVAAARLSGSIVVAGVVTMLTILSSPRTYSYPKLMLYAIGAWAILQVVAAPSRRRIAVLGAIVAVAFLFRHDHGLYIGAASAVAVTLVAWQQGARHAARAVAWFAASIAVVLLPWLVYVALNDPLTYIRNGLEFSRIEARATLLTEWPAFERRADASMLGLRRPDRPLVQITWIADTTPADRLTLERKYTIDYVRDSEDGRAYYVRDASTANLEALGRDPSVAGSSGLARVQRPAWRELVATLSPLRVAPAVHTRNNAIAWLFWLFWILPPLCAVIAVCRWRAFRLQPEATGESIAVLALAVLAVAANAGFIRETLSVRLPDAVVPAALLGAWLLGVVWTGAGPAEAGHSVRRPARFAAHIVAGAITIVALVATVGAIAEVADLDEQTARAGLAIDLDLEGLRDGSQRAIGLLLNSHRDAPPSRYSRALVEFFEYTDRCTATTDRFMTNSLFPELYVLARRGFAAGGLAFTDGHSPMFDQDRTVARLRAQQPPFAFMVPERDDSFRDQFPPVAAYLDADFAPLANWDGKAEPVRILVNRTKPVVRIDADTGWPCFY